MHFLTNGEAFGPARCHMYTVEWQKRGLPHAHILLWLTVRLDPNKIDSVITAEIPDYDEDPLLHNIIKRTMIHGPCGPDKLNAPCTINGKCSKGYPRSFLTHTVTGLDGYPLYRRRSVKQGGKSVTIANKQIENNFVVPYNPTLSRMFDAHINVEYCASIKSIKYICKYINKGSDQAAFSLQRDTDEITNFVVGRYISTDEAMHRIYGFLIHDRSPSVEQLCVHLENGQRVNNTGSVGKFSQSNSFTTQDAVVAT